MSSKKSKTTKATTVVTTNAESVRIEAQKIGDSLAEKYHETGDLKVASTALVGYRTAIAVMKAKLIYKKLTGAPSSMPFFEDDKI
jgi:hypothetical protein